MPVNRLAGGPQSSSEDLYTKIALDNKLITRFQVRQACKEQEDLNADGQELDLGNVMVRLGFLTERQHQSVLNACRYREQRDYDKRFARQMLRMDLLSQEEIEVALDKQKGDYSHTGTVTALGDLLEEGGQLSTDEIESVHKGIAERDRARTRGRGAPTGRPLAVSGPTPVLDRGAKGEDDDLLDGDLDDGDLDDEDLDDEDLDGLGDLDDVNLDDVDLDDEDLEGLEDLDDEDLDSDLGSVDDLDDEDLDSDLGSVDDLDDEDLDDVDLDDEDLAGLDDELEDALGDAPAAEPAEGGSSDLAALNLDDLDEADLDVADLDGEDEADLAQVTSELDSEVHLDEEDLQALEEMGSEEELEEAADWAAEAFDDRPIHQRPSSEAQPALPPTPPAAPPPPPAPAAPRAPRPSVPSAPRAGIPGGNVFDENLSDIAKAEAEAASPAPAPAPPPPPTDFGPVEVDPLVESVNDFDNVPVPNVPMGVAPHAPPAEVIGSASEDLIDPRDAPSEERRALIESAVTDAVKRALSSSSDQGPVEPSPASSSRAAALAAASSFDPADPRLRQAFERAMESAWQTFLEELQR